MQIYAICVTNSVVQKLTTIAASTPALSVVLTELRITVHVHGANTTKSALSLPISVENIAG